MLYGGPKLWFCFFWRLARYSYVNAKDCRLPAGFWRPFAGCFPMPAPLSLPFAAGVFSFLHVLYTLTALVAIF